MSDYDKGLSRRGEIPIFWSVKPPSDKRNAPIRKYQMARSVKGWLSLITIDLHILLLPKEEATH